MPTPPSSSSAAVAWSDVHDTPSLTKSSIVFTSGSTVTIDAPKDLVWSIILDHTRYSEWNSWCPRFDFPEGKGMTVGSVGTMKVKMEAQKRDYDIPEKILVVDETPDKNTLAWRGMLLPSWAGTAERVQEVVASADGASCELKQWESMAGWSTYIMKYLMSVPEQIDESNLRYAEDLKKYAEAKAKSGVA